jgi:hypothetical protein
MMVIWVTYSPFDDDGTDAARNAVEVLAASWPTLLAAGTLRDVDDGTTPVGRIEPSFELPQQRRHSAVRPFGLIRIKGVESHHALPARRASRPLMGYGRLLSWQLGPAYFSDNPAARANAMPRAR